MDTWDPHSVRVFCFPPDLPEEGDDPEEYLYDIVWHQQMIWSGSGLGYCLAIDIYYYEDIEST